MAPYIPDEAGVKQSLWTKIVFFWKMLLTVPRFWPNRPHLVAARTETVRGLAGSPGGICTHVCPLIQFIRDLQEQGYTSIAVAGCDL